MIETRGSAARAAGFGTDTDRYRRARHRLTPHRAATTPALITAMLLAGTAITAPASAAGLLDLGNTTVSRNDLENPPFGQYDFVENGTLVLAPLGFYSFTGVIRDGAHITTFQKLGAESLALLGHNTYSGETLLTSGSTYAGDVDVLSPNSRLRLNSILDLNGFDQTVRGFYQSGSLINGSNNDATLTSNPLVDSLFSGTITEAANGGTGRIAIVKAGSGIQALTGTNSYSLGTSLQGGTLGFGNGSLGSGTVTFTAAATLRPDASNTTIANPIFLNTAPGTATTIDTAGHSPVFAGIIGGTGQLRKIGLGPLILTNSGNGYSGGTLVTEGELRLGGDNVLGPTDGVNTGLLTVSPIAELGTTGIDVRLDNPILLDQLLFLNAPAADTVLTLNGVISGTGSTYVRLGAGTILLNAANTYVGTTFLTSGIIGVGNDLALGGGAGSLFVLAPGPSTLKAFADNLNLPNVVQSWLDADRRHQQPRPDAGVGQ